MGGMHGGHDFVVIVIYRGAEMTYGPLALGFAFVPLGFAFDFAWADLVIFVFL